MYPVTPDNKCKQSAMKANKEWKKNNVKAVTRVVEDDQIFEIETQGQMSEFSHEEKEQETIEEETDTETGKAKEILKINRSDKSQKVDRW